MGEGSGKAKEIVLGDDFGDVVVKANGARVSIGADGTFQCLPAAANDGSRQDVLRSPAAPIATCAKAEPKPGERMPDGTTYAGLSPDTGKPLYTTPEDAPLTMKWKAAMKYAANLDAHGHKDWRVPTEGELNVLFKNRAAISGFNVSGWAPAGWYWSSTQNLSYNGWDKRFNEGRQYWTCKLDTSSLRCVRG